MKNHFHLRLTPKPKDLPAITPDISGMLQRFDKYVLAYEISEDSIPHYHLYGETDECEKTVRSHVVSTCQIPIVGRGKTNGYYCFKFNQYSRPSPEYVCAEGDIRASKGYTKEALDEYIRKGKEIYVMNKRKKIEQIAPASEASGIKVDKSITDLYFEYIDEVIPKQLTKEFTVVNLRANSISWWRKRNGGLMPVASTYKRFLVSAILELKELQKEAQIWAEVEIEKYGY